MVPFPFPPPTPTPLPLPTPDAVHQVVDFVLQRLFTIISTSLLTVGLLASFAKWVLPHMKGLYNSLIFAIVKTSMLGKEQAVQENELRETLRESVVAAQAAAAAAQAESSLVKERTEGMVKYYQEQLVRVRDQVGEIVSAKDLEIVRVRGDYKTCIARCEKLEAQVQGLVVQLAQIAQGELGSWDRRRTERGGSPEDRAPAEPPGEPAEEDAGSGG